MKGKLAFFHFSIDSSWSFPGRIIVTMKKHGTLAYYSVTAGLCFNLNPPSATVRRPLFQHNL